MKKVYLFIILLCLVSYGCEKNISLNIAKYDSQIVVYCIMSPFSYPQVYLSHSQSYYSYADTDSTLSNTIIQNAQVIITDQAINKTDTLHYDTFAQSYIMGPRAFNPTPGHHYALKINYQGKVLTSETTVPMQVKINHVDYVKLDTSQNNPDYEFHVFFNSVTGGPNYYSLNGESFISDNGVAGKQLEIITNERFRHPPPDTAYFALSNMNKVTADYFTNINIQNQSAGDPFSQPAIVEGNINGGLGIFGANAPGPTLQVIVK